MGSNMIGSTNPLFLFPFEEVREIALIYSKEERF